MDNLHRLLFVLGLLAIPAADTQAAFVWGYTAEVVNDSGADTASVIVKGTADANQVANADSIEDVGVNSLNVKVDLLGQLDGSMATITATNLIPFGPTSFFGGDTRTVLDGGIAGFVASPDFSPFIDPKGMFVSFSSLVQGGSMFDIMRLDITVPDGFEAGVDSSMIKLTIDSGGFPTQTQLGKIGSLDEPFNPDLPNFDPLYARDYGAMTTLTVVPEPSSFLFLGLVGAMVGGMTYMKKKKK